MSPPPAARPSLTAPPVAPSIHTPSFLSFIAMALAPQPLATFLRRARESLCPSPELLLFARVEPEWAEILIDALARRRKRVLILLAAPGLIWLAWLHAHPLAALGLGCALAKLALASPRVQPPIIFAKAMLKQARLGLSEPYTALLEREALSILSSGSSRSGLNSAPPSRSARRL